MKLPIITHCDTEILITLSDGTWFTGDKGAYIVFAEQFHTSYATRNLPQEFAKELHVLVDKYLQKVEEDFKLAMAGKKPSYYPPDGKITPIPLPADMN